MKSKFLVFGILTVLLGACAQELPSLGEALETSTAPIVVFPLEDDSGNILGFGTPLKDSVFVAPDHLWQVSQALYYQGSPIEVLARDFRHDLIFFALPNQTIATWPAWSNKPPGVGQVLSWKRDEVVNSAPVLSARAEFLLGNVAVEDLMQLSVRTDAGSSGLPLYNEATNQIYGMLIAADALNDVSYFVRSDVILTLADEYIGFNAE